MFEKTFSVPYFGLDMKNSLKSGTLLDFFQETAARHAQSIGIGVPDLLKRDATWVLRRYRVNIRKHGGLGAVTVRTWYEPKRNLVSVRMFEAVAENGETIADAWSGWVLVDLKRGRPVRLDHVLPAEYYENAGNAFPDSIEDVEEQYVPGAAGGENDRSFRVRMSELDLNGHANHTVYFDWAMESVPDETSLNLAPIRLDAEYLASVPRTGVTVRTRKISDSPQCFAHSVILSDSGLKAAKLATMWG
jgi:acyl-ACP thioesterase